MNPTVSEFSRGSVQRTIAILTQPVKNPSVDRRHRGIKALPVIEAGTPIYVQVSTYIDGDCSKTVYINDPFVWDNRADFELGRLLVKSQPKIYEGTLAALQILWLAGHDGGYSSFGLLERLIDTGVVTYEQIKTTIERA